MRWVGLDSAFQWLTSANSHFSLRLASLLAHRAPTIACALICCCHAVCRLAARWGLTTVLISWDVLREDVTRLDDLEAQGYSYVLSRPVLRKELLQVRRRGRQGGTAAGAAGAAGHGVKARSDARRGRRWARADVGGGMRQ